MKKWLFRIVWIPVFVLAVFFLVANRALVALSLDPFSASAPSLTTPAAPLWFWLIVMVFIGFGAGAAGMWVSGRDRRLEARAERRELKTLRSEVVDLRVQLEAATPPDELPKLESSDV